MTSHHVQVADAVAAVAGKVRENVATGRFVLLTSNGTLGTYVHSPVRS